MLIDAVVWAGGRIASQRIWFIDVPYSAKSSSENARASTLAVFQIHYCRTNEQKWEETEKYSLAVAIVKQTHCPRARVMCVLWVWLRWTRAPSMSIEWSVHSHSVEWIEWVKLWALVPQNKPNAHRRTPLCGDVGLSDGRWMNNEWIEV